MGLEAGNWASRLRFGPGGWDEEFELEFGLQGRDLGLQARIWASRLRLRICGRRGEGAKEVPQHWASKQDLSMEIRIWALILAFRP